MDKNRSQNDDIKAEVVQSADNRDSSIFISDKRSGSHIHEMIDAGIIVLGDELRIDKKYHGIQVNIRCKIAKITTSGNLFRRNLV
ncbi:unnamed protein product [Rhizophagus irregularis]|nr:unnamed protein product [Rhizophagus irregularis]